MKQKIRIIASLLLVFCVFGGTTNQAIAAGVTEEPLLDSQIDPRYVYLNEISANIEADVNAGEITSKAVAYTRASGYTVKVELHLQKYTQNTWSSVRTWNDEGVRRVTMSRDYSGAESGKYRTLAVVDVYDASDNLIESVTQTSNEILYVAP